MIKYTQFLQKYKLFILIIFHIMVFIFAIFIKDISFNGSYRIWFEPDSKVLQEYDRFKKLYKNDDKIVVAFEKFDNLIELKKELSSLSYISGIDYIDFNPSDKYAILTLTLAPNARASIDNDHSKQIVTSINRILTKYKQTKFYISGASVIYVALIDVIISDLMLMIPLVAVMIGLFLYFLFRRVSAVIIPLFISGYTIIIVESLQIILGYELNNFTADIPVVIVAISIATTIHLYSIWIKAKTDGQNSFDAVVYTLSKNFKAIFLTSVTTSIGFASLATSNIVPIYTLGIIIALSSLLIFLLSYTILPILLLLTPYSNNTKETKLITLNRSNSYGKFIVNNDKKIIIITIAIMIVLSFGISRSYVDNSLINYLSKDTKIVKDTYFIQDNIIGVMSYDIVVDSNDHEEIYKLSREFNSYILNKYTQVRYVSYFDQSIEGKFRLTALLDATYSSKDLEIIADIKKWWQEKNYTVLITGQTALFTYMQDDVSNTLIYSILVSLLLIFIVMSIVFEDKRLIPLYLIPNTLPLLVVMGIMGWSGIAIDFGVAISAAVILGIAVDDSMHFLVKYFDAKKRGLSLSQRFDYFFNISGRAIIISTIILSSTFLVLLGSNFMPNISFAIVTSSALVIALIADLLLLPAILSLVDKDISV